MELTRKQLQDMSEYAFQVAVEAVEKTVQQTEITKVSLIQKANNRAAYKYALSVGLRPKKGTKEKIRKRLNESIISAFKSKKIKQINLAICAQTSKSRISRLLNRKTGEFTIDAMINILDMLGGSTAIK